MQLMLRGFGSWMKAGGKTQVNFNDCLAGHQASRRVYSRCQSRRSALYFLGESMGGAIALESGIDVSRID